MTTAWKRATRAQNLRHVANRIGASSCLALSSVIARAGAAAQLGSCASAKAGGGYVEERIGTPNDIGLDDGQVVLDYKAACDAAQSVQLGKRAPPAPKHYADGQTLNAVLAYYFAEHLAGKGSERIARGAIALYVADGIGNKLVTALDAEQLRRWHKAIAAQPATRRQPTAAALDRRYSLKKERRKSLADPAKAYDMGDPANVRGRRATANRVLTIVKAALNYSWKDDKFSPNQPTFWKKVEPFALGEDPLPRMLEGGEITRLLRSAPQDLRQLLEGALMTGARYSELRRLLVRDYDADSGTVRLVQTKTSKTLTQPLTPEGVALFDRLTLNRPASAPVFVQADGRSWNQSDAAKPMRLAAAAARLVDVSFKATRATYGKLLLQATGNIELVAKALGHSDSRITRKHYAQYVPSELALAVAKLPALGLSKGNVTRINRKRGQA